MDKTVANSGTLYRYNKKVRPLGFHKEAKWLSKDGNIMTHLEIIEDYKNRDKDCYRERYCIRCDRHITYCKNAPTIKEAIVRAVMAKDERGKMNKHQCRVRKSKFKMLIKKLLIKENSIKNVKDFDELI